MMLFIDPSHIDAYLSYMRKEVMKWVKFSKAYDGSTILNKSPVCSTNAHLSGVIILKFSR